MATTRSKSTPRSRRVRKKPDSPPVLIKRSRRQDTRKRSQKETQPQTDGSTADTTLVQVIHSNKNLDTPTDVNHIVTPNHGPTSTNKLGSDDGSEDRGVNSSVLKIVDEKAKLPMFGTIESLNVSVACGAFLYEVVRQRQ